MAEPFSLATGALSTVALGVRVCGELHKYLGAIKNRRKELSAAWDASRTLATVFERLDGVIIRLGGEGPEDTALLARCLNDANVHLLELRDVLRRLKGLPESSSLQSTSGAPWTEAKPSGGIRDKAKQAERALTYSVHRDGVKGLLMSLQHLTTTLNCGILTVILKDNEELAQNVKNLQTMVSSTGFRAESRVSEIRSDLASLLSQHETTAADLRAAAQENSAKLSTVQDDLLMELSFINQRILIAEKMIHDSSLKVIEGREEAQIHGRAVLALLQKVLNQLEERKMGATCSKDDLPTPMRVLRHVSPASLSQAVDCFSSCPCQVNVGRSTAFSLNLHDLHIFSRYQIHSHHERRCSLYGATQKRTREVGANLRIRLGSFLSCLIEASLWCSTSGAGGCSFGSMVRWKNLVPREKSPVYQEFYSVGLWLMGGFQPPVNDVVHRLRVMQKIVLALYQSDRASINDVDSLGNNHLQNFVQLVVRWIDQRLLRPDLISIAMSMIDFYIDGGLICSERDTHSITPNTSSWWKFLPSFNSSTTLAKTLDLIMPYGGGRISDHNVRLVSSVAQASEPLLGDFIQMVPYVDPSLFFTRILDYDTCGEKISPLARAIISRSLHNLERAVKLCPESLLEKTQGLTVLHLAVGWPPGLSFLLATEARRVLDTPDDFLEANDGELSLAWPFSYAAASQCAQSLGLLLGAGCNLCPIDPRSGKLIPAFSSALKVTSAECAEVFASHMNLRRKGFLALAKSNLDRIVPQCSSLEESLKVTIIAYIGQPAAAQLNMKKVPSRPFSEELITKALVTCLERAMVHIPTHLRPSGPLSENIYHLPGLCLAFFPIFAGHGFDGYNEPDQHGLRPLMVDVRSICSISRNPLADNIKDLLPWLITHGCLDLRPVRSGVQPRAGMSLNEGSTGWHYLSLVILISQWGRRQWWSAQDSLLAISLTRAIEVIAEAGGKSRLDGCICWCNLQPAPCKTRQHAEEQFGRGCSPFSFLCKQYLEHDTKEYAGNHFRACFDRHDFWHHVFRHGKVTSSCNETCLIKDEGGKTAGFTPIPMWQLELVRLLTFEALEMTHTCCSAHQLQPGRMELAIFNHPDPKGIRDQLIADHIEADKVLQLEDLMVEFAEHIRQGTGSPRDLEVFLCGPWRARVAGLYNTCHKHIKTMEDFLGAKVQTSK